MSTAARWLRAFGRFWKDFLLGDTPLFFPATLVAVGVAFALRHERDAAIVVLPVMVAVVVAGSVIHAAYRSHRNETAETPEGTPADDEGPVAPAQQAPATSGPLGAD